MAEKTKNYVEVCKLHKAFYSKNKPKAKKVLKNINLSVKEKELVSIFGPNGCGKTTLLKSIAGIEKTDNGKILVAGDVPRNKKIALIFQNYADSLMPWLTSLENILFPHDFSPDESSKKKAKKFVFQTLKNLELKIPLHLYSYQLSGGQQQAVSLLRAISSDPDILLMDEPFSSLDYVAKRNMHELFLTLLENKKLPVLIVTHDLEEAIFLADKIVLLSGKGSVLAEKNINFSRPRKKGLQDSQEFLQLKKELLSYY